MPPRGPTMMPTWSSFRLIGLSSSKMVEIASWRRSMKSWADQWVHQWMQTLTPSTRQTKNSLVTLRRRSLTCLKWWSTSLTCSLNHQEGPTTVASLNRLGCSHQTSLSLSCRTPLATLDLAIRLRITMRLLFHWVRDLAPCRIKSESLLKTSSWRLRQASSKETLWKRLTSTFRWESCQKNKANLPKLASTIRGSICVQECLTMTLEALWH